MICVSLCTEFQVLPSHNGSHAGWDFSGYPYIHALEQWLRVLLSTYRYNRLDVW